MQSYLQGPDASNQRDLGGPPSPALEDEYVVADYYFDGWAPLWGSPKGSQHPQIEGNDLQTALQDPQVPAIWPKVGPKLDQKEDKSYKFPSTIDDSTCYLLSDEMEEEEECPQAREQAPRLAEEHSTTPLTASPCLMDRGTYRMCQALPVLDVSSVSNGIRGRSCNGHPGTGCGER